MRQKILTIAFGILLALIIFFSFAERNPTSITSSVTTFNLEIRDSCTDKEGKVNDYCSEPSIVVKWNYEDNHCVAYKFLCPAGKYCTNGMCIAEQPSQTNLVTSGDIICGINQPCVFDGSQSTCINCDKFRWKIKEKYPGCEDKTLPRPMDACLSEILAGSKAIYTFTERGEYSAELQALKGNLILDSKPVKLTVIYAPGALPKAREVPAEISQPEKKVFFETFWDDLKRIFGL